MAKTNLERLSINTYKWRLCEDGKTWLVCKLGLESFHVTIPHDKDLIENYLNHNG